VAFPAGVAEPLVRTHKGRADQAIGVVAWRADDFWSNPQRARETILLADVLRNRLTDELREVQGASYSPNAEAEVSRVWADYGFVEAQVEVPPAKLAEFFSDTQKIAADLAAKEISADELARAKKPRLENIQRSRVTNEYWLAQLSNAQREPRRLEVIRDQIPGAEKVTAADIQRAAQTYLKPDKAWKLVVKPQGGPAN
jgi:zinc protease